MKRCFLYIIFALTAITATGCEIFREKENTVHADPNGTIKEQIAYHHVEIEKYKKALERQEKASSLSMKDGDMSEVRKANNKKMRYQRQIIMHKEAIVELKKRELNGRPFVGR